MQKFGFFQLPPFTYPTDEMDPSGLYANGRLIGPNAPIDVGRVAIGQERLAVTPLQMAQVAATVANGGVRMAPTPGGQGRHQVRAHGLHGQAAAGRARDVAPVGRPAQRR